MLGASHTRPRDPVHVRVQHMNPMHAALGSVRFKAAFYLTRDALFSYFSILKAEMVTPLSGELHPPPPPAAGTLFRSLNLLVVL